MPFSQLSKNPAQLLLDHLYNTYTVDPTIQNPPREGLKWGSWFDEIIGIPTIYGSDREDISMTYNGGSPVEYNATITIHIFEKTLGDKPEMLEKLKLYFDKRINESQNSLDNVGIANLYNRGNFLIVPNSAEEDVYKLELYAVAHYWKHELE